MSLFFVLCYFNRVESYKIYHRKLLYTYICCYTAIRLLDMHTRETLAYVHSEKHEIVYLSIACRRKIFENQSTEEE